jgi:hypothetical protein
LFFVVLVVVLSEQRWTKTNYLNISLPK